ncbi:hypothetical protein M8818_004335 [Zalaria obscura]|uniref:Uncharacterized protein n=1 Tax=Zalaria obscura TaxID=2024903 RepID=A0ACC3SBC7_9PEZI
MGKGSTESLCDVFVRSSGPYTLYAEGRVLAIWLVLALCHMPGSTSQPALTSRSRAATHVALALTCHDTPCPIAFRRTRHGKLVTVARLANNHTQHPNFLSNADCSFAVPHVSTPRSAESTRNPLVDMEFR